VYHVFVPTPEHLIQDGDPAEIHKGAIQIKCFNVEYDIEVINKLKNTISLIRNECYDTY
jgi:hypothetical protein